MPEISIALVMASAVIFAAAFVHGLSGFGSALVAMPLLALLLPIRTVAPLVALLTLTQNAWLLLLQRRSVSTGKIVPLIAGALAGIPFGVVFLAKVDEGIVTLALGVSLTAYALFSLLRERPLPVSGNWWGAFMGLLSGCLGGAFNGGGPPAVVYLSAQPWKKEEVHASLQLYFFLAGPMIVVFHLLSGLTTGPVVRWYLLLLPALVAGSAAGLALHRRVSGDVYRKVVYLLLLALGILLLVK
jgi:uncharacterized membrane protein YfcA